MAVTRPQDMNASDLVALLHPVDADPRQHALSATYQVKELLRYLVTATEPWEAERAMPAPHVANDTALALRDGLPSLAELLRQLAARYQQFAADPRLVAYDTDDTHPGGASFYAAAAVDELNAAAELVDQVVERLHIATAHAGMISIPGVR